MTGPRSIKAVQDWISVNADHDDTTAREVITSLPSLPTGQGWVEPRFLRNPRTHNVSHVQHLRFARHTQARTDTGDPEKAS